MEEETTTLIVEKGDTDAEMEPKADKEAEEENIKKEDGENKPSEATVDPNADNSPTFADKLMELLQNDVDSEAIWWLPDNESFGINKQLFEDRSKLILLFVVCFGSHQSKLTFVFIRSI